MSADLRIHGSQLNLCGWSSVHMQDTEPLIYMDLCVSQ